MRQFRVIDLRSGLIRPEHLIEARSPEDAAVRALGEKGIRGSQQRTRTLCQVYWVDAAGQMSMVRLYRPVGTEAESS